MARNWWSTWSKYALITFELPNLPKNGEKILSINNKECLVIALAVTSYLYGATTVAISIIATIETECNTIHAKS